MPGRERRGLGTIAAGKNGDLAAFILENAREFFDDGCFPCAADCEIADSDDLDAEGAVAKDADAVKEAAQFHEAFENLGKREEAGSNKVREFAAALFEDDFENECFGVLNEIPELFLHRRSLPK